MKRRLVKKGVRRVSKVYVWSDARKCYVASDRSVLEVACPVCGSGKGKPCVGPNGYKGTTHYPRRYLINSRLKKRLLSPLSLYRQRRDRC